MYGNLGNIKLNLSEDKYENCYFYFWNNFRFNNLPFDNNFALKD